MTRKLAGGILVLGALLGAAPVAAQAPAAAPAAGGAAGAVSSWKIDTAHSELSFRIRHLISRVRGTFGEWEGTIVTDPDRLAGGSVEVRINTASIDTNNERRDNHLRSDEFFDAANHPVITFRSRNVAVQGKKVRVAGDLTMRGVTKPVVLEGEVLGLGVDGQGKRRIGFEASTTINRLDYGVSWNRAVEGGGVTLGDEVDIALVVSAVQQ